MNPDYLSHIFSTKAEASLSSYIMDERMAAAKRLLATTGFSPPSKSVTRSESKTFPIFTGSSRKAAGRHRSSIGRGIFMDNHEHWSVPEKGLQRAKKQSVLGFFRSHALCFISYPQKSARSSFR